MKGLVDAAGDTYVEVNSGGAAVIARAVQAATNPTEGQRMLQAGFDGAILGGESREKMSTTSDSDGIVRVDRVVERSVVGENGQEILVQQVQQSAQQLPPSADIEMAVKTELIALMSSMVTKAQFESNMSGIVDSFGLIQDSLVGIGKSMLVGNDSTMNVLRIVNLKCAEVKQHVDAEVVELEGRTDGKIESMKKTIESTIHANDAQRDANDKQRDAKDEEHDANDKQRDANDKQRDANDAHRDSLIASLQRAAAKQKKRPADVQGEGHAQKKSCTGWSKKVKNIYKKDGSDIFKWKKHVNKKEYGEGGFTTMEQAVKALAEFLENNCTTGE